MSTDREAARAAERRYRASAQGRALRREQRRRWRARNPKKVQATVALLKAHGRRREEERRLPEPPQPHVGHELAITKQRELRRLAGALREAEDRQARGDRRARDEIERLRREQALPYGPIRKPIGSPIVGLDLGITDNDPVWPFSPF